MSIDGYMICTTPRSGSTLLCRMLTETGQAGHPASYFHRPSVQRWMSDFGLASSAQGTKSDDLAAVFAAARARGTGETGLFGLRMQRGSFDYFIAQAGRLTPAADTDLARIEGAFGRMAFVHLSRRDKLGQAISRCIAEQSGLWRRNADGSELERLAPHKAPVYDAGAIAAHLAELSRLDSSWASWFADEGLAPLRLWYEDLAADPNAALARVLAFLGRNPALAPGIAPPVARLADRTNARWAERYRAEHGSQSGSPPA